MGGARSQALNVNSVTLHRRVYHPSSAQKLCGESGGVFLLSITVSCLPISLTQVKSGLYEIQRMGNST